MNQELREDGDEREDENRRGGAKHEGEGGEELFLPIAAWLTAFVVQSGTATRRRQLFAHSRLERRFRCRNKSNIT
ncbi:hypothetical protein CDAR_82491 [Caerostris darwini]|uniref:Uncharacterized protein n=1 Tax=Caerostris darwini TaxID=1538125 RepID=A0AAV4UN87_9ARAC|nr:hypothetical protein CDAR_82491 [Caerostris darwini]